ncbi:MAG: hypothetical protein KIS96_07615 [Bauldia sp.]|nr:hypothetical protein [Bauldia sp.]
MAEPTDAILPILKGLQADMAATRRGMAEVKATLDEQAARLTEMNGYLALSLNTQTRHTDEIDALRGAVKAPAQRVSALEAQRN